MKRIGIIKLWALGDIVMATPMLTAIRAKYPECRISWVVDEAHGEILHGHPDIDDLVILDTGSWRRLWRKANYPAWITRSREIRQMLAAKEWDAVINCHPDKWFTAILCPAPLRIGLYPSPTLPALTPRLYTHVIPDPRPQIHATRHYLQATQALDCPDASLRLTLGETPEESSFFEEFQQRHGSTPYAAILPFTTAENKCWEPERYAALADTLWKNHSLQCILPHSPKDEEAAHRIASQCKDSDSIRLVRTNLRQYVALLRRAALAVSGDTSALHLCTALDTPYVSLFGPTDPRHLAPLFTGEGRGEILLPTVSCAPCNSTNCRNAVFRTCMKEHSVSEVSERCLRVRKSATSIPLSGSR